MMCWTVITVGSAISFLCNLGNGKAIGTTRHSSLAHCVITLGNRLRLFSTEPLSSVALLSAIHPGI